MSTPPLSAERLRAALSRRIALAVRAARARRGPAVTVERLVLHSTAGYKLDAWVHRVEGGPARKPALILCPGIDDGAAVFEGYKAPINADEAARLGYIALRFDPAGRGQSWGEEDYGGPEHQDDVATLVRLLAARPDVDPARIGLVAISLGVAMAVGAAAQHGAPVAWVLDWEGPSDREIITAGGARMAPAAGHANHDEVYWRPREAVRHVGALPCAYLRLQAERDHAQPGELRHVHRMMHAAREGALPWLQLNDHPRGEVPPRPSWIPDGPLAAHRALHRKLASLRAERRRPASESP